MFNIDYLNSYVKLMGKDNYARVGEYITDKLGNDYSEFSDINEVNDTFGVISLSMSDTDKVREYSGYYYKFINASLRGNWNYDIHGNGEKIPYYKDKGREISDIIINNPCNVGGFKTYRGVPLNYFFGYGVRSFEDLKSLEGNFFLDPGFLSTSVLRKTSFYNTTNEAGVNYNVEIEYLVPDDFSEGIYLREYGLSYSPKQNEYVVDSCSLSYVNRVEVRDNTAFIQMILIPKVIYDDYYKHLRESKKS